jgi:hypothetical protein
MIYSDRLFPETRILFHSGSLLPLLLILHNFADLSLQYFVSEDLVSSS